MEPSEQLRLLEAVLMVVNEPISARHLAGLLGFPDPTAVRTAVIELNGRYDRAARAYRIEEVAGGLQILTRKQFALWLRRTGSVPAEQILSSGMLETLAIIAFVTVSLGGFGSITGALVAGLLIGVIESLSGYLIGAVYKDIVVYTIFIAVLWFRPQGLMGKN
jgi:hypothetical protein